jgi:hypothetical protein
MQMEFRKECDVWIEKLVKPNCFFDDTTCLSFEEWDLRYALGATFLGGAWRAKCVRSESEPSAAPLIYSKTQLGKLLSFLSSHRRWVRLGEWTDAAKSFMKLRRVYSIPLSSACSISCYRYIEISNEIVDVI